MFPTRVTFYVVESMGRRCSVFNPEHRFIRKFGRNGNLATSDNLLRDVQWASPFDVDMSSDGNLSFTDFGNSQVISIDNEGNLLNYIVLATNSLPTGIRINRSNDNIYVVDYNLHKVCVLDINGNILSSFGSQGTSNGFFTNPIGIDIHTSTGNVYVSDNTGRVQIFTSDGSFVQFFGSFGYNVGQFNQPRSIRIDNNSNLVYVADLGNNRVQVFDLQGNFLNTFGSYGTGSGQFRGPSSIAIHPDGSIYVTDFSNNRVQKFDPFQYTFEESLWIPQTSTLSKNGELNNPNSILIVGNDYSSTAIPIPEAVTDNTTDGVIYIADNFSSRIVKLDGEGNLLKYWNEISGYRTGQIDHPSSTAVDTDGYVYVADTNNHRVEKFSSNGDFITEYGINPTASPLGIALSSDARYIFVTDPIGNYVYRIDTVTCVSVAWGGYGTGDGQFNGIGGIVTDSADNVYVADSNNHLIKVFWPDGTFIRSFGGYGTGTGQLNNPYWIARDKSGNFYIAERGNHRIQKFKSSLQPLGSWGYQGSEDGDFETIQSIFVDQDDNVYVIDTYNTGDPSTTYARTQTFTSSGIFIKSISNTLANAQFYDGNLDSPKGGNSFVTFTLTAPSSSSSSSASIVVEIQAEEPDVPDEVFVYGTTYVYVTDTNNHRIQVFRSDGATITRWGSFGNGNGQFNFPNDIAVDALGQYVYVADTLNHRVQQFTYNGIFIRTWGTNGMGNGQFSAPMGIAIDIEGYVYVIDCNNSRVQKFTSTGLFQSKWGTYGTGDGQFNNPHGISIIQRSISSSSSSSSSSSHRALIP